MTHVHLIGIGGTGLSAIARILLETGYKVSGSDQRFSSLTKALQDAGANIFLGHQASNVDGADIVVRSSAVSDDNVEVIMAKSNSVPVLKRAEFLNELMTEKFTIAVAGTHGKSTTTAMIAWMLTNLGEDPSFICGGVISGIGVNAKAGSGSAFVIEADEYDRMFLGLTPNIAVVTNIEHDHPDCFPSPQAFHGAFRDFIERIPKGGPLLACGDDVGTDDFVVLAKMKGNPSFTYGIRNPENYYQAIELAPNHARGGYRFNVLRDQAQVASLTLRVPGLHNVQNALAALSVADQMGLTISEAANSLSSFPGVARRFEVLGEEGGVIVISDYGHHPTEIEATLSAARVNYPGRTIWAVWQPHTFSRTKLYFNEFCQAFENAHQVIVTEVYPAREPVDVSFSANQIVNAMKHPHVKFISTIIEVEKYLMSNLQSGDVMIVLSAGDADQICYNVLSGLGIKEG
jgi:UDP-N-acetylmuramate--alanine ligase